MIHDLDIVLALDGSEPTQIEAVGVPVLTSRVDIANARLRFASGLIANLTASRVSVERSGSSGFRPANLRLGGLRGPRGPGLPPGRRRLGATHHRLRDARGPEQEPLCGQIEAFLRRVRERSAPVVSAADGRRALSLAHAILGRMAD